MRTRLALFFAFGYLMLWTAAVQHDPFFWDTVQLGSKHAHFFYENGLRWQALPADIDSGHPPVFGYYLALMWWLFGKTLPVSHWVMLPFLIGIAWLLFRLGARLAGRSWAAWLIPVVLLDPVFAGQSVLVSPDIVLACFFLLALEGLFAGRQVLVLLGIAGLCAISMRGMMTAAALLAWQAIALWRPDHFFKPKTVTGVFFVPGFAFAAWFLWWHFSQTGWIGFHSGSPWAASFEPVRGAALLKNIAVIGWRWVDTGRIFEWLILGYLLLQAKRKPQSGALILLLGCLALFLTPSALLYHNLSAKRYFLPFFLGLHLLALQWIGASALPQARKQVLFLILIFGLGTGNFWIYPTGISMDWDATLASQPYHRLRREIVQYLDAEHISFQVVGSAFPNLNTGENLCLNGDQRQFSEKDFEQNTYVLASNIFNDFSRQDFQELASGWVLVKRAAHGGIWMELYRKYREPEPPATGHYPTPEF